MTDQPKKSLGQHWLRDQSTLEAVVRAADIGAKDTVLEIGPGLGTLTEVIAKTAKKVIAIEKDPSLVASLARSHSSKNVEVIEGDILRFDLSKLPPGYKVAANIPYYLTSNLLRKLLEDKNPPKLMALLVQKEVAERIVARPGAMSVLAFSVQYYGLPQIIKIVLKELFEPPPKVDSAILQIQMRPKPAFSADQRQLFRLIKFGFSNRRKQLKNSLAAGLHISNSDCANLLEEAAISPTARAQDLSLQDWQKVYKRSAFIDK